MLMNAALSTKAVSVRPAAAARAPAAPRVPLRHRIVARAEVPVSVCMRVVSWVYF